MCAALARPGNASSVHAEGRAARAAIETARIELGAFVGAPAKAIVFTSGGTEALNLALTPHLVVGAAKQPFERLLIGAGEHAAALAGHRFPADGVEIMPLTPQGVLDLEALESALARNAGRRVMLALQAANNETGVIQPVAAGAVLVCDAVQAAGKTDCDIGRLEADALIVSGHKFGGPQGVGALCFADPASHIGETMIRGGGQERGARAGTENVAAIAGMAGALRAAGERLELERKVLAALRDGLESEIAHLAGWRGWRIRHVLGFRASRPSFC
jgi:cysteine desulfurase